MHIFNWDAWAQKTIPVPHGRRHEYYGASSTWAAKCAASRWALASRAKGTSPAVSAATAARAAGTCARNTVGVGVDRQGCFAEYLAIPAAMPSNYRSRHRRHREHPRSVRQRDAHRPCLHMVGEDVLITGAGPIGIMPLRSPRRSRTPRRHHRRQRLPARARAEDGRDARRERDARKSRRLHAVSRDAGDSTWGSRCLAPVRVPGHAAHDAHGGSVCVAGHSARRDGLR